MSIGYACLTQGIPDLQYKTCIQKNATPQKLMELIAGNLRILDQTLDYNISRGIYLFRVSSDIIPFGSSPVNRLEWDQLFAKELTAIGEKALSQGIRLSMHPGQYTVLNSPNDEVVTRAVDDLIYHNRFLDALHLPSSHKIILHIGGIYGDKEAAMERFCMNYRKLPQSIHSRLIIENDDKLYTIEDVWQISQSEKIPIVFDTLHYETHHTADYCHEKRYEQEKYWIDQCRTTWTSKDGRSKIHYSQQAADKKPGSHSPTVYINEFMNFYNIIKEDAPDIMLEVKDKNLSAVKCILTTQNGKIPLLEQEWARYKYNVLEHSPVVYQQIRQLLKDKKDYPAQEFYSLLETALDTVVQTGTAVNAAQHVWGYFKDQASDKEKMGFEKRIQSLISGKSSVKPVKNFLRTLAVKYEIPYLLNSFYFTL